MAQTFNKDPSAIKNYGFDWSAFLGNDTITTSSWIVPAGITKQSESNTTTRAIIWLSGGTHGEDYLVTNQITTSGGVTEQMSLKIQVREQ